MVLLLMLFILLIVCWLLLYLLMLLMSSGEWGKDFQTSFECGFNPLYWEGVPFSGQFFSIIILFLVFDVEIVVLLPILLSDFLSLVTMFNFFVLLLIFSLTLIIEWYYMIIKWSF